MDLDTFEERNRRIIEAVLEKGKQVCPGAIALIGIYGSFLTGDVHPASDLDLLILVNDDRGERLSRTFIQDDLQVGHDLYCTNWEQLRHDALYEHPHIAKLMDARVVYAADESFVGELENLRAQVREKLAAPFDAGDYEKAEAMLREARQYYAQAMTAPALPEARRWSGAALYYLENAFAMLNKTYFRRGVQRVYEELAAMEKRPEDLCALIENVVSAPTAAALREALTVLMRETEDVFRGVRKTVAPPRREADREALRGTYEEMVSNWRGKLRLAAAAGNRHLAFMSLLSYDAMLQGLSGIVDGERYEALPAYDPEDLPGTARRFEDALQSYLQEYRKMGLEADHFPDVDAFIAEYLSDDADRGGK